MKNQKSDRALEIARPALTVLIALNLVYMTGIILMFVLSLTAVDFLFDALRVHPGDHRPRFLFWMRSMMLVGVVAALVVDRVLRQLRAIVDTVRAGDPFIEVNSWRLHAIAWWVLAGEILRLLIGVIDWAASTNAQSLDVDIGFSLAPWLAVLLLFVLARVFAEGTRMRADLEGTV
jgi:hypothetical protein